MHEIVLFVQFRGLVNYTDPRMATSLSIRLNSTSRSGYRNLSKDSSTFEDGAFFIVWLISLENKQIELH